MSTLLACPFCRDVVANANACAHARTCAECEILLVPLDELPPHLDADADASRDGDAAVDPPEHAELPWSFLGRGRGALIALCILGFAAFFAPWCHEQAPELTTWTAYQFAAGPMPWLWGGVVAWFVMFPLVLTRRSVAKMRGARVICTAFAAMTTIEAGVLLGLSRPDPESLVPIAFTWAWGIYASLAISVVGVVVAARLGGRLDEFSDLPRSARSARSARAMVSTLPAERAKAN